MVDLDVDVVLVGAGPANLALAIALEEEVPELELCVVDAADASETWHSGLRLPGAMMQIHALKDLATLRNPRSQFGVVSFLSETDRLFGFLNNGSNALSRQEFAAYLSWVEEKLKARVYRNVRVLGVKKAADGRRYELEMAGKTSDLGIVRASCVSIGIGGSPRPEVYDDTGFQRHASDYLRYRDEEFGEHRSRRHVCVVGGGQSAVEVSCDILSRFENSAVTLITPDVALRASDDSPFMNEYFDGEAWAGFRHLPRTVRDRLLNGLKFTNYGVANSADIRRLHSLAGQAGPGQRLSIRSLSRVKEVKGKEVTICGSGGAEVLSVDSVIWATGFDRRADRPVMRRLLEPLGGVSSELVDVDSERRVVLDGKLVPGVYILGSQEAYFGIGETLISSAALRAGEMVDGIRDRCASVDTALRKVPRNTERCGDAAYPRRVYFSSDRQMALDVAARFPLATVAPLRAINNSAGAIETAVPLAIVRQTESSVVFFGHLDANNVLRDFVDGPLRVVFRTPNAYISPSRLGSDALPTWNFCTVTGAGLGATCKTEQELRTGLQLLAKAGASAAFAGNAAGSEESDLDPNDPRIGSLLPRIVGFTVQVEQWDVYAKMSQDRTADQSVEALRYMSDEVRAQGEWVQEYNWRRIDRN